MNPNAQARIINDGRKAAATGKNEKDNPYEPASEKGKLWLIGFND
jgi:hypothetical protein